MCWNPSPQYVRIGNGDWYGEVIRSWGWVLMNGINVLIKKTLESSLLPSAMCACMLSCSVMFDFLLPLGLQPTRLLCPRNSPKNTGFGCHFLLQGIFPTQGSNPCLLHLLQWQADSIPLSHLGSPCYVRTQQKGKTPMDQEVGPFPLNLLVPWSQTSQGPELGETNFYF